MLKQQTRERLQALVQNPGFEGSVDISDSKYTFSADQEPTYFSRVNIHGKGFGAFTLLADLFPDMEVKNVRYYESESFLPGTINFGDMADGKIDGEQVNIWACYGERKIEKDPAPTESIKELSQSEYNEMEVIAQ